MDLSTVGVWVIKVERIILRIVRIKILGFIFIERIDLFVSLRILNVQ